VALPNKNEAPGWPEHIRVVDFDPFEHGAFVRTTFAMSIGRPVSELMHAILDRPGVTVLVATPIGEPTLVGWLAAVPSENRIVAAYTKAAYRALPEQRQGQPGSDRGAFRVASSLAIAAGIDFSREVPCSFWSRAARDIARRDGNPYNLVFKAER